MSANTEISWCVHTFNPWHGCSAVSEACQNCYAAALARWLGFDVFGPDRPRRFFGGKYWAEPVRWARNARRAGRRDSVFCLSMGDVLEDRPDLEKVREEQLWPLVRLTAGDLTWIFLTKRPENWKAIPGDVARVTAWGVTAENQRELDRRGRLLLKIPAAMRFLSCEPLLEGVEVCNGSVSRWSKRPAATVPFDLVIVGGESGPKARLFDADWARAICDQCHGSAADVPCTAFYMKQFGRRGLDLKNGIGGHGMRDKLSAPFISRRLKSRDGRDPAEWPVDLQEQHLPDGWGSHA